ncbi:hypothetical protein Poli38472_012347 [Pythium oligandrum]|uniref:Uncharacterized protein n=1 Tax=Pythium oligandrum TaxID=41045 RepID=A0A8K1FLK1_PYTOL|nr:hypothetical protein Poli38472_012347 [Pythium oligandrum]|eukprot:TMW67231.1 hypothetical protein Poli38472_012347 [Pythium oligandrum]
MATTTTSAMDAASALSQLHAGVRVNAARSPLSDTSRAGSDSDVECELRAEEAPRKKYKATYYARKDEITALQTQIASLSAHLDELKSFQPLETRAMEESLLQNSSLRGGVQATDLALASFQSEISNHTAREHRNPLKTYIYLVADPVERQRTLESMWRPKIHDAVQFMLHRTQAMDLRRQHRQREEFRTDTGDYVLVRWEVMPFRGHDSVKEVFDNANLAQSQVEFTIGEQLGITAIRQVEDDGSSMATSYRFLATTPDGVDVEKNNALFRQFFPHGSELLGTPHGISITDSVDVDEMYPYDPHQRIRYDCTAATLVRSCPPTGTDTEPVVSIVDWSSVRVLQPHLLLTPEQEEQVVEFLPRLIDVSRKVIHQHVRQRTSRQPAQRQRGNAD